MAVHLPNDVALAELTVRLFDPSFEQTGVGGTGEWIERPGARFEVEGAFPPLTADQARVLSVRLMRARREKLRLAVPLVAESQGQPGSPVVDGNDSGGTVLKLRSVTPHYVFREGYRLTVESGGGGTLHTVIAPAVVAADGTVTLALEPPLRAFPADGAAVHVAAPWIEGRVTSPEWMLTPDALRRGFGFTLREAV